MRAVYKGSMAAIRLTCGSTSFAPSTNTLSNRNYLVVNGLHHPTSEGQSLRLGALQNGK